MSYKLRIEDVLTSEYSDFISYCSSADKIFISELSNFDFVAFRTSSGQSREYVNKIRSMIEKVSQANGEMSNPKELTLNDRDIEMLSDISINTMLSSNYGDLTTQPEEDELNEDKANCVNDFSLPSTSYEEELSNLLSQENAMCSLAEIFNIDPSVFAGQKIANLNLDKRSSNALRRLKIETIDELLSKTVSELQSAQNIGVKSINMILQKTTEYVSANATSSQPNKFQIKADPNLCTADFKSAIDSLLSGKDDNIENLSECQQEYYAKLKDAVNIIGSDICSEAYIHPIYSAHISNALASFAETYSLYWDTMQESIYLINRLPESMRQLRATPFIQAYLIKSNNSTISRLLFECEDSTKIIDIPRLIENIWQKGDFGDWLNQIPKFLKWMDFDLTSVVSTTLEQLRNVCSHKRTWEVFMLRYKEKNTLETVGNKFDLTRERIRQIESKFFGCFWKTYALQKYDIISLIYALRNGDIILNYDKIKAVVPEEFALILKPCLKNMPEHNFYSYSRTFDAVIINEPGSEIIDETSLVSKINQILDLLPSVINVCDKEEVLKNYADNNSVPLEILTHMFNQKYFQTNSFLHRGHLSVVFMCEYVLKHRFQFGYKTADKIETERFKQYLSELFGEKGDLITPRSIDAKIGEIGVLCDRGKYIHPDYLQVEDSLLNKINEYIETSPRNIIWYREIFEALKSEFDGSQITNHYILHGAIKKYGCKYNTSRDFIKKVEYATFVDDIESFVEARGVVHKSEILAEFAFIDEIRLSQVVLRCENVFSIENGYYIHANQFDIQLEDYEPIRNYLIQSCSGSPIHITVIYDQFSEKFPSFMYRNDFDDRNKLYAALYYMFREDFSFSRPYIAKLGTEGVTNRSVILQQIADYDTIEIEDIIDICEEKGINCNGKSNLFKMLAPDFIRVSGTSMMRKEYTGITEDVVNKVIDNINALLQANGYIVGTKIPDFLWFPKINIEWNEFLLESILAQSNRVGILNKLGNTFKRSLAIYVSDKYKNETFDSFLIKILQNEVRKGSFNTKDEMRDWLKDKGFIDKSLPRFLESEQYFQYTDTGVRCIENV